MGSNGRQGLIRILIADDHTLFREGLRTLLETKRRPSIQIVSEACNGEEAVLCAKAFRPDIVLMDLDMPRTDGIAATRLIRDLDLGIKVLILSNYHDDDRVYSAMRAGACGYVVKRAGITDLVEILKAVHHDAIVVSPFLINLLLQHRQTGGSPMTPADFSLTDREVTILKLLTKGYSNKEIANAIYISLDTVKVHLKHIFEKLGVDCRTKAVVKVIRHSIIGDIELDAGLRVEPTGRSANGRTA
jgi:DNA-binding NarL/FixJ family response regulator